MQTRLLFLLILFSFFQSAAFAQDDKKKKFLKDPMDQAVMDSADFFFQEKNYTAALQRYNRLMKDFPEEQILLYRSSICELYQPDGVERSLQYLQKVNITNYQRDHSQYYYARALMLNYKFEEAIPQFEKYIANKWSNFENRALAEEYIMNCKNGINLMLNPVAVDIVNIGSPINSPSSEYVPLINSTGDMMLFTYRGPKSLGGLQKPVSRNDPPEGSYNEDIFISTKNPDGTWTEPKPVEGPVNTKANDAAVFLSDDAQKFYIFRSVPGDEGTLYMSELDGNQWGTPEKLYGKINSPWWEGSISISADGRIAYFSSERPGGFGGKDLYTAELLEDGSWGNIKNLGPFVNTKYDEDAPFIHPSGEFMLFSSKGHNSMGGYDIFRTDLVQDSSWSEPFNIGYPINTPGDDIYYVITGDGTAGYYSSGKAGGFGLQDIYKVEPGIIGKKIQMVRVKGTVTLDDQPVYSQIKITYQKSGLTQGIYNTNSVSGKYLINLPKNREIVLNYFLDGYAPQTRNLSTVEVNEFFETTIDVQFYSEAYLQKLKQANDSLALLATRDTTLRKNNKENTSGSSLTRAEIMEKYGDLNIPGLTYHVQIGAYNLPQNFSYTQVLKLGQVEKQKLDDNITRFTIGTQQTFREARAFCDKVIGAGISDAFVTAEYKGKRYLIAELVAMDFKLP